MSDESWDIVCALMDRLREQLCTEMERCDSDERGEAAKQELSEIFDALTWLEDEAERARDAETALLAKLQKRAEMDAALVERLDVLKERLVQGGKKP